MMPLINIAVAVALLFAAAYIAWLTWISKQVQARQDRRITELLTECARLQRDLDEAIAAHTVIYQTGWDDCESKWKNEPLYLKGHADGYQLGHNDARAEALEAVSAADAERQKVHC